MHVTVIKFDRSVRLSYVYSASKRLHISLLSNGFLQCLNNCQTRAGE